MKGETSDKVVIFEKEDYIQRDAKTMSIFIQTDKAIYKPGNVVKMRALVVDADLKPISDKVTMEVHDPADNILAQWNNVQLTSGVISKEMQLADETTLGDWTIKVKTGATGLESSKTFSVDKYVLPKFEVTLEPPSYITEDKGAVVKVRAK